MAALAGIAVAGAMVSGVLSVATGYIHTSQLGRIVLRPSRFAAYVDAPFYVCATLVAMMLLGSAVASTANGSIDRTGGLLIVWTLAPSIVMVPVWFAAGARRAHRSPRRERSRPVARLPLAAVARTLYTARTDQGRLLEEEIVGASAS